MRQSVGDMVRSMALVLGLVAVIVLLAWRPQPEAVKVVDPAPVIAMAEAGAGFPVAVPTSLPSDWRATSARWEPTPASGGEPVLHIGYVTPSEEYAQVAESTADSDAYLAEQTAKAVQEDDMTIADTTWQTWRGQGRRSLVRTAAGVVTIVSGSAPWEELAILAASLQVRGG
jgi:hypothetical protein